MIVTTETTALNNSGLTSSNFTMKASAHAFKILTTSLYQNKELAVLREYFANAYDAIRDEGKTDPVRICLPTELEPNLVISDNGNGMGKETLTNLYSTFFDSTKQHTNDAIGGFGLGSKSAFSMTDTFTVTSIKDSKSTTIVAFIDGGTPKLVVTNESTTTEPNGTTVTIPVSNKDTQNRLKSVAYDLFIHTPIKPIVTIGTVTPFTLKESPDYKLYNGNVYLESGWRDFNKIVIGLFTYTIPSSLESRIQAFPDYSKLRSDLKSATSKDCVNFVLPLGALELSPSRETVEDTPANAKKLFDIFKATVETLLAEIAKYTPFVYNYLSSFITTDLSTYEKYQNKLNELTNAVPKQVITSINNILYGTDCTKKPTIYSLHSSLAPNNSWFRQDSDGALNKVENIFNYSIWYNQANVSKLTTVRKLVFRGLKPKTTSIFIEKPESVIYVTNTKSVGLSRYYNNIAVTVTHNNEEIPVDSIYAIEDPLEYAEVLKIFANYVVEIPSTHFELKATRKPASTPSTRTPKGELEVFEVVVDTTNQSSGIVTPDFYSLTYPDNTQFILLSYGKDHRLNTWKNIPALIYNNNPVVVLKELRSGETKNKRFESFVEGKYLEKLASNDTPMYCRVVHNYYSPDKAYLRDILSLTITLAVPSEKITTDTTNLSKLGLYRLISREGPLKYYRLLLPRKHFQVLFNHIWKAYTLNYNLKNIINDILCDDNHTNVLVAARIVVSPSTLSREDCIPLQILSSARYANNAFYPWVFSHPTAIAEIKACINPQLGA